VRLLAVYLDIKVVTMHIGIIISLIFTSLLFFLWQFSKGEQVGQRIGFLLNLWGAVIVFYLLMVVIL
tara:strand:- start:761 stop:961 length:201 start_codon:yes stop_codon:yes gene_type:complete